MFHCVIRGPISRFPHQVISFSSPQFPHFFIKSLQQWRTVAMAFKASRVGESPTRKAELRKKMKENWGKWEKIQENEEKLRKCSYLAHPGVRGWLRPWFAIPPLRHQRAKGPKFSIAPLKGPNFLIMSSKWWPLITSSRVPIHHCVIKGPPLWPLISHHVIKGSNLSLRHQGPHFPHRVIKGTQISKIHHEMCTE